MTNNTTLRDTINARIAARYEGLEKVNPDRPSDRSGNHTRRARRTSTRKTIR